MTDRNDRLEGVILTWKAGGIFIAPPALEELLPAARRRVWDDWYLAMSARLHSLSQEEFADWMRRHDQAVDEGGRAYEKARLAADRLVRKATSFVVDDDLSAEDAEALQDLWLDDLKQNFAREMSAADLLVIAFADEDPDAPVDPDLAARIRAATAEVDMPEVLRIRGKREAAMVMVAAYEKARALVAGGNRPRGEMC